MLQIYFVPTEYFIGSPDNDWIDRDDYVLYVDLDGSLGDVYDVERSYGSPVTITYQMVLHVEEDGHTYNDPDNDTILDSYGK